MLNGSKGEDSDDKDRTIKNVTKLPNIIELHNNSGIVSVTFLSVKIPINAITTKIKLIMSNALRNREFSKLFDMVKADKLIENIAINNTTLFIICFFLFLTSFSKLVCVFCICNLNGKIDEQLDKK